MRAFHYFIATGLGSGYTPGAPGTAGTILAWLIAYFLLPQDPALLIGVTLLIGAIGIWSATMVERDLGKHDPGMVVVDEMVGMWLGLWLVPHHLWLFLIALGLFRLFDIWKPFPINSIQKLPEGWGIMMDDVGAGIYTLLLVHLIRIFFFPGV